MYTVMVQLKHHGTNVKLFFQLVCSVQLFPILLTLWCLCWTKKRAAQLHRFLWGLDSKVHSYFHVFWIKCFWCFGENFFFTCHFMLLMLYGLLSRCMERSVCSYHYDWYPDCTTVVHLRFCQGLFQTSSPTSTWNARISEEEAWSNWIDNSWTDCWLSQWWVSWNFYIFDYVEKKTLYNVIIGCALVLHEGLNSTTVIAWNKWETECLVSVYYCICKLHFIVANTSNTLLASPSPAKKNF